MKRLTLALLLTSLPAGGCGEFRWFALRPPPPQPKPEVWVVQGPPQPGRVEQVIIYRQIAGRAGAPARTKPRTGGIARLRGWRKGWPAAKGIDADKLAGWAQAVRGVGPPAAVHPLSPPGAGREPARTPGALRETHRSPDAEDPRAGGMNPTERGQT